MPKQSQPRADINFTQLVTVYEDNIILKSYMDEHNIAPNALRAISFRLNLSYILLKMVLNEITFLALKRWW